MRLRARTIAMVAVLAASARTVHADVPSVDVRQFRPPVDPAGSLYMEPAGTPGAGAFNTGMWLSYGWRPAVVRDESGAIVSTLIRHQLAVDLIANIGITTHGSFGLDVPVMIYQTGSKRAIAQAVGGGETPPAQAMGDIGLVLKANVIAEKSLGGFGLSAIGRYSLPTGATASYMGEGMPVTELRLLGEYRLIAIALQATAGFATRGSERDVLGETYGNGIPWGAALSVRPQAFGWDERGRWTWVAEVHGMALLPPSSAAQDRGQVTPVSPAAVGLSVRYGLGLDLSAVVGAQSSLSKALGAAPVQAMASIQWAPRVHDADNDGVSDDADQCPELPEDHDGFEEEDGCPDWDNDGDDVADTTDKCPNEAEDFDGYLDQDGCPDWDNDSDGIPDKKDACPTAAGPKRDDPKTTGCPDRDGDGLVDRLDKCPDEPGPRSKNAKRDGCPVLDRDEDGIPNTQDACPDTPGPRAQDPKTNGCPWSDSDGDGILDQLDKCPDQPETYNGIDDEDGCPDAGGTPLVALEETKKGVSVRFSKPIVWTGAGQGVELDPASAPVLRALALELFRHKDYTAAIGVRPADTTVAAQQVALGRAFAVVQALQTITHRDGVAETVGYKAVEKQPDAKKLGYGVLVLQPAKAPPPKPAAKAEPKAKTKAKP